MHASPLDAWLAARGATSPSDVAESRAAATFGDLARELAAATGFAALFDASAVRDRVLVTGADRLELIQGLTTNDVELLPEGGVLETAFITPKGRLVADARMLKLDDALLFELESGRGEALSGTVQQYVIHEDAALQDVSENLAQLELWGPRAAEVLGSPLAEGASVAAEVAGVTFLAAGTVFGAICFVPADVAVDVATELARRVESLGGSLVGTEAIEIRRIELGLGRYGLDWDEATNPLEAGLDREISYKKGCYVGQEVVAKATYIGRVNRRLVRLEWHGDPAPRDTPLLGGRSTGRLTSSARRPDGTVVALGYVRRETPIPGGTVRVGEGGPEARVLGYPYGSRDKPV
jgi:folate-binding protein YgfZ